MGGAGQGDDTQSLAAYIAGLDRLIQKIAARGSHPAPAQLEREKPMTRKKTAPGAEPAKQIVLENCASIEAMQGAFDNLAPGGTLVVTFPRAWFLAHSREIGSALPASMSPLNIGTFPDLTDRSGVGIICSRSRS